MEECIKTRSTLIDEQIATLVITVGQPHRPETSTAIDRGIKQKLVDVGICAAI